MKSNKALVCVLACWGIFFSAMEATAQAFDSGSTGADGALILTEPGTVIFDPTSFDPPLDPEGDNIYHFTDIFIGEGVTVRLGADKLGSRPVYWLATGDVVIDGGLDLNGEDGHGPDGPRLRAVAGAGGYGGGLGRSYLYPFNVHGQGPGAGLGNNGASHASNTRYSAAYGNRFLIPLLGGSGGGGGTVWGGGAGGGAILIASSTRMQIEGAIRVDGGNAGGGSGPEAGGGGSGGAVRLMAPILTVGGTLSAQGGTAYIHGHGSHGRISLESHQNELTGTIAGAEYRLGPLLRPALPDESRLPRVALKEINGLQVPVAANGHFPPADMSMEAVGSVTAVLEAQRIPLGTEIQLKVISESGQIETSTSTPLEGTFEQSTATATFELPLGFSQFTVQATWTPTL